MIEVLDAVPQWGDAHDGNPQLALLLAELPEESAFVYTPRMAVPTRTATLWYAEHRGVVRFFAATDNHRGYGGRPFTIRTAGGHSATLRGPWSSRAGVMMRAGFGPCLDVVYTADRKAFDRGFTFTAGAVTLELAERAVAQHCPGVALRSIDNHGEPLIVPARADGTCIKCAGTRVRAGYECTRCDEWEWEGV
jgi:hypothetical protein